MISVVHEYLNKLLELESCPSCGQPKILQNAPKPDH